METANIHTSAIIDEGARIGAGTRIWHFCHIMSGAKIGRDCNIGQNAFIADGAIIGDGVKLQNNVSVYGGVILEDEVFCGPSVVFTNVLTPRAHVDRKKDFIATRIGHGATLGANVTVVCGNRVGAYALVGAGSVVTRDVPEHALLAGNPASQIGWVCRCGEVLIMKGEMARCHNCGDNYREDGEKLTLIETGSK